MRLFFIANTTKPNGVEVPQHSIEEWVCTNNWSGIKDKYLQIADIAYDALDDADDFVYIIDVHCTFTKLNGDKELEVKAMQEHGGVAIYRHLLHVLDGMQERLRVVFYSPIKQADLVALRPENYVVNELPFVDWNCDGKFGETLSRIINDKNTNGWPRFNNASENLLSGWALANKKNCKTGEERDQIDLHEQQPLVIDDEWDDWQRTYKVILSVEPKYFLAPLEGNALKSEFRKLRSNDFDHVATGTFKDFGLIISDLYLHESHESDRFKTNEFVRSISGFQLFKKIRASDVEPAIPVLFHTTSTKFRIFEILKSFGSAGQVAKNISANASSVEKLDSYLALKEKLEKITEGYSSCWYRKTYSSIAAIGNTKWLPTQRSDWPEIRQIVHDILKHVLLVGDNLMPFDEFYLEDFFRDFEVNSVAFNAGAIVRSVGLIPELFKKKLGSGMLTPELTLALHLRNHASHPQNYGLFTSYDAKLITVLLVKSLQEKGQEPFVAPFPEKNSHFNGNEQLTHPVFDYHHYYNNYLRYIPDEFKTRNEDRITIQDRINTLAADCVKRTWSLTHPGSVLRKEIAAGLGNMELEENYSTPVLFSNGKCILRFPK